MRKLFFDALPNTWISNPNPSIDQGEALIRDVVLT